MSAASGLSGARIDLDIVVAIGSGQRAARIVLARRSRCPGKIPLRVSVRAFCRRDARQHVAGTASVVVQMCHRQLAACRSIGRRG